MISISSPVFSEYADEEEEYYEYEDGDEEYYEEDEAEYDVASVEANLEHEFRPQKGSRRRYDEIGRAHV